MEKVIRIPVEHLPFPMQEFVHSHGDVEYVEISTVTSPRCAYPRKRSNAKGQSILEIKILGEELDGVCQPFRLETPSYLNDDVECYVLPAYYLMLSGDYSARVMMACN